MRLVKTVADARREQIEGDIAVLQRHAQMYRFNEMRNREIGNAGLEEHNHWCAAVLDTAIAALRAQDHELRRRAHQELA